MAEERGAGSRQNARKSASRGGLRAGMMCAPEAAAAPKAFWMARLSSATPLARAPNHSGTTNCVPRPNSTAPLPAGLDKQRGLLSPCGAANHAVRRAAALASQSAQSHVLRQCPASGSGYQRSLLSRKDVLHTEISREYQVIWKRYVHPIVTDTLVKPLPAPCGL